MDLLKILIIEDEIITALGIKIKLEQQGHTITGMVCSSDDAFHSVKTRRPDIIISDLNIHGNVDGLTTVEALKHWYNIPFIIISACDDKRTFARIHHSDALGFFPKPFNVDKIHALLTKTRLNITDSERLTSHSQHSQILSNSGLNQTCF